MLHVIILNYEKFHTFGINYVIHIHMNMYKTDIIFSEKMAKILIIVQHITAGIITQRLNSAPSGSLKMSHQ